MTDQPIESYTKEDSQTSKEINELAGALSKAQGQITGAVKDSENPFFKSKYADLAAVMDACRDPLSKNNLSYVQLPGNENGIVNITTILMHTSGQWIKSKIGVIPSKMDAQGLGSVTTYLRRYGLSSMVGIAQIDDDGQGSVGTQEHITSEQALDMGKLVDNNNMNEDSILAYIKSKTGEASYASIKAVDYDNVMKILKAKVQKREPGEDG